MIDFDDKEFQIQLNEERLREEYARYHEIRSRIALLSIFYTGFAAYTVQLTKYAIDKTSGWIFVVLFLGFLVLLGFSIYNAIQLLIPKEIAFKDLPKSFYDSLRKEYLDKGISEFEVKYYVRETYQTQLEKAVESNFLLNNRKVSFIITHLF